MIDIQHLSKEYRGQKVLDDISFHVKAGEIFGIIGGSGAGKSTLLSCLNGLIPFEGSITIDHQRVETLDDEALRQLRKSMGFVFQQFHLLEQKTVFDNIALPLRLWKVPEATIKARVEELLRIVRLEDKALRYPRGLSGGEKQRVGIARALAHEPRLLLCDEITSALDPHSGQSILRLLRRINEERGITIVFVTHQMESVKAICHRLAELEASRLIRVGETQELFLQPDTSLGSFVSEEKPFLPEGANICLYFDKERSQQSIIAYLAKEKSHSFSIVSGRLERFRDDVLGHLVLNMKPEELPGFIASIQTIPLHYEVLS